MESQTFPKWVVMPGLGQPQHYITGARTNDLKIINVTVIYVTPAEICITCEKYHVEEELTTNIKIENK